MSDGTVMFFPEYQVRLRGLDALRCVTTGSDPQADLAALGREIAQFAARLAAPASSEYAAWGELLRAIGHLVRWGGAVREAEIDSDRHLRAAKQRAHDVLRHDSNSMGIRDAATAIVKVSAPEDLRAAALVLLRVRLPLPFPGASENTGPWPQEADHNEEPTEPLLAFLQFYLGGQAVMEPHDLRPNVLYDLRLEMRLSESLGSGGTIEVTPYTVEPEGAVDAPTFRLEAVGGHSALFGTGRLRIRVAHDALARPLEISYGAHATFSDREKSQPIGVQGQSKLLLRCVDESYLWRGNRGIQDAVLRIRDLARSLGLPDPELSRFLELLGAVGVIAADALANDIFHGDWTEAKFHSNMRSRLRSDATIGPELEDHPHVSGGITDLSFHRIRLELKVDARHLDLDEAFQLYGQQLAQYVVGSDRRSGILAILCKVKEGVAPGLLENDIGLRVVAPPTGGDRGVAIGIVLIRSNLATPSSLSR